MMILLKDKKTNKAKIIDIKENNRLEMLIDAELGSDKSIYERKEINPAIPFVEAYNANKERTGHSITEVLNLFDCTYTVTPILEIEE